MEIERKLDNGFGSPVPMEEKREGMASNQAADMKHLPLFFC